MLSAFTAILHVPNMSKPEHIVAVLEVTESFTKSEIAQVARHLQGRRYMTLKSIVLPVVFFLVLFPECSSA